MLNSKFKAERYAMDLRSVALGIREALRLLRNTARKQEGEAKLSWLQSRLERFKSDPTFSDSLQHHLKRGIELHAYERVMQLAKAGDLALAGVEINGLVASAKELIDESSRATASIKQPL